MIKVRQGVFETNSSSTHAIIIAREGTHPYNRINFSIGEYGWEQRFYDGPNEKASYFYTAACALLGKDVKNDIVKLLEPYGIECEFRGTPVFRAYDYNGKTEYYLDNGYVDHYREAEDFVNSLMNDASLLIDFIFNDESYVETGNDNDDEPVGTILPKCKFVEFYKGN